MPARNRNPIQISRVSLACLALLVAVCGGYVALVPFLKAIEPSPSIGSEAKVNRSSVTVPISNAVTAEPKPTLVSNQLKPKKKHPAKPKKPAHKTKRAATTVPTRPVLVTNQVRPRSTTSSTPTHTSTAPAHTHRTPTHATPKKPAHATPKKPAAPKVSHNRRPVVGVTNRQGSGLASRGSGSDATVSGGVSSTPAH
jgi:hypothetical protein